MASIVYTAHERAPLITTTSPAHTASSSYGFDVKLQHFEVSMEFPGTQHVSMSGIVETILRRSTDLYLVTLVFPNSLLDDVREFLYSVAGGETFQFDAEGSIATPDNPVDMVMASRTVPQIRISHGFSSWRTVTFNVREYVSP